MWEVTVKGTLFCVWCSDIFYGNGTFSQWISNVILKVTLNYVY